MDARLRITRSKRPIQLWLKPKIVQVQHEWREWARPGLAVSHKGKTLAYSKDTVRTDNGVTEQRLSKVKHTLHILTFMSSLCYQIWKPDTTFLNGQKSYLHKITVPNRSDFIYYLFIYLYIYLSIDLSFYRSIDLSRHSSIFANVKFFVANLKFGRCFFSLFLFFLLYLWRSLLRSCPSKEILMLKSTCLSKASETPVLSNEAPFTFRIRKCFLQICYNYELVHKMCYCIYNKTTTGQGEGQKGSGPRGEGKSNRDITRVPTKKPFDEGSLFLTSSLTLNNQRNHRSTNIRTWGFIGKSKFSNTNKRNWLNACFFLVPCNWCSVPPVLLNAVVSIDLA